MSVMESQPTQAMLNMRIYVTPKSGAPDAYRCAVNVNGQKY